MTPIESINKKNIIIGAGAKTRQDIITEMTDNLVKNKFIKSQDRDTVISALIEREKSMSTGIGNSVAIPHCTTDRVSEIIISIATSREGIDFRAIDNAPVKIIIMLLVPKEKNSQHIRTLAGIARIMNNPELREKITASAGPEEILDNLSRSIEKK